MNVIEALEATEKAAQGNERLETLSKYDSPELRKLLYLALSPDVTFGVKKLPEPELGFEPFRNEVDWYNGLLSLLEELRTRRLTGGKAQKDIAHFRAACLPEWWKWTERVIKQDLRMNVGAKDVNKAFGEEVIYLFAVPLATDFEKVKEKDLKGEWIIQPKLDGGRVTSKLSMYEGWSLKTRTGKDWPNFESIRSALQKVLLHPAPDSEEWYLDGEVVSYVNGRIDFQSVQKTMMRKDGVEVGELRYILFDVALASEWQNPKMPYEQRLAMAERFVQMANAVGVNGKIEVVPSLRVTDPTVEQLREICMTFVSRGYEGLMMRRPNLPVENKRGKRLLKVKLFKDDEAEIIGVVEGQGKYQGTLGALVCKTKEGVTFEIGTGLVDATRDELWKMPDLIGKFVNFKYFELTNDRVPRLPVYRSLRAADDIGSTSSNNEE